MSELRDQQWDRYLAQWSIAQLQALTLEQYCAQPAENTLSYWLLKETETLGDFVEGPLSMGIRPHKHGQARPSNAYNSYDDQYVWLNILGTTAQEAFATLKAGLLEAAEAGRTGQLERLDALQRQPGALMRKVAFLYQDRQRPCLLPIFNDSVLRDAVGEGSPRATSALHRLLFAHRGELTLWAYADQLMAQAERHRCSQQAVEQTIKRFHRDARLAKALRNPQERQLFHRLAQALHSQGLDWWIVNLDQGYSIRSGRKSGPVASKTRVYLRVDPQVKQGLQLNFGDEADLQGLSVDVVQQMEQGEGLQAFLTAHSVERDGYWPDDYAEEDAQASAEYDGGKSMDAVVARPVPLNQILFGPPGTGKTYNTINQALAIMAPDFLAQNSGDDPESRARLKAEFDRFVTAERVRFVTFHQSFSYEDFVEGLRADSDAETGQVKYSVESGVFKRICDDARTRPAFDVGVRANPAIWKISIAGTGASPTKSYCLANGEARIGWGKTGDLRGEYEQSTYYQSLGAGDKGTLNYFAEQMVVGDILLCIHSAEQIGSIGVVTSDYRYEEQVPAGVIGDYQHVRSVRWLYRDINLSILPLNDERQFTLKTVYVMNRFTWADLLSYVQQQKVSPVESVTVAGAGNEPYVLIIDEINRGNVSRIFGELITLVEESKREGADEALSVKLPYSKKPFSVPKNVYLIGTMNTADRSLAGLDIALRRRFVFREMPPRPELLHGVVVEQCLDIGHLLLVMNQRIEVLLDRDHCLGHAYFMPLKADPSLARLELIFRNQILPLLQEYFFEDWERIGWVLNDQNADSNGTQPFIRQPAEAQGNSLQALFGSKVAAGLSERRWELNDEAFASIDSYRNICRSAG